MVSRKYTKDYRVEAHLTKRGAIRDEAIYCGAYYRFARPKEEVSRSLRFLTAAELVSTAFAVFPMCVPCAYSKQMYVILPLVVSLLPIYLLFAGLYRVRTAGEKVIHEHRDKIANRIPTGAFIQMLIAGLALIGTIVYIILGQLAPIDWVCSVLALLRAALSVLIFLHRHDFAMEDVSEHLPATEQNPENL